MRFANPEWLLLALLIPVLIYRYIGREKRKSGRIRFSDTRIFRRIGPSLSLRLRHSLIALRCVALLLLIAAMARPQSGREGREILSRGIDIALAIDVSSSMEAKDLANQRKTRLEVCKEVVAQFAQGRTHDRSILAVFPGPI